MKLIMILFGLTLSTVCSVGIAKEFPDELACKSKIPSACLRMALRSMGAGKREFGRLLRRACEPEVKSKSTEESEATLVAGALLFGNTLTTKINNLGSTLESGCDKDKHALACLGRAFTLSRPGNTSKEREASKKWITKSIEIVDPACQANDGFSCYLQANFQASTANGAKDFPVTLLEKACRLNEPAACLDMGRDRMAKGDGENALKFLRQACELNYSDACFALGNALRKMKKTEEAITLLKAKCKEELATSCGFAALILNEQNESDEMVNSLFLQGCELGDPDSCEDYANRALKSGKTPTARVYFRRSCEDGNGNACLENGKVEASLGNKKEASRLYSVACDKNSAAGCTQVGLEKASPKKTMKESYKASLPFFRKAHEILNEECSDGSNDSCEKLKNLAEVEAKYGLGAE